LFCGVSFAQSRSSVAQLATSELLRFAQTFLEDGKSEQAVPYLEEVVIRFAELKGEDAAAARTAGMYQLGLCYLETGQFVEAAEIFQQFVQQYPQHASVTMARFLVLESFAWQNDAQAMRAYIDRMEASGELDQLVSVFNGSDANTYRHAALSLSAVYARMGDLDNLRRFLPYCDEAARGDVGLNLALMEGGDRAVENRDYLAALAFYRQVQSNRELLAGCDLRLAALKKELSVSPPWVPLRQREAQAVARTDEEARYERMVEERRMLAEKNYDIGLMMRLAQCYEAMERHRIAYLLFENVYTQFPESREAESARYAAFRSLIPLEKWTEAQTAGQAYIEAYPDGRYRDETALSLMHVFLGMEDFAAADEQGRRLLSQAPIHRYLDQVNYLMGSIQLHEQNYEEALAFFSKTAADWPNRPYAEDSVYWIGMCNLFLGRFEQALEVFEGYLTDPARNPKLFAEDVSFRIGMARYGLDDFTEAKTVFQNFLKTFPESDLTSEACSMLGDLYGADGEMERALAYYRDARRLAVDADQAGYAIFQMAKVYELLKQYDEIIALMDDYLSGQQPQDRFAEACLWIATSWKALGEEQKALETLCGALYQYGADPQIEGADQLLEALADESLDSQLGVERAAWIMERLAPARIASLSSDGEKALGIRLTALFAELSSGEERAGYLDLLLDQPNLEIFSPHSLLLFARESAVRGDTARVQRAYDYFTEVFKISSAGLEMSQLRIAALLEEDKGDEALALVDESLELYFAENGVGVLQKLKADVLRQTGRFNEAFAAYNEFLSNRAWRGSLTPQALYWAGACAYEMGDLKEAAAYFQRVYVMYEQHSEWVAKAYEGSVRCLQDLGRQAEAVQTWREMTANSDVAATPEGQRAQAALDKLKREAVQ